MGGNEYRICVIPGDGIGPEVTISALRVLEELNNFAGLSFDFRVHPAGISSYHENGEYIPDETLKAARNSHAVLFGAVSSPDTALPDYKSPVLTLRRELDLSVNIRPIRNYGQKRLVDFVIFRENTEDLYIQDEEVFNADSPEEYVISKRKISASASQRLFLSAMEYAFCSRRKNVMCVHKANVLRKGDGLFLKTFYETSKEFPSGIKFDDMLVDRAAMEMVLHPEMFDVVATTNLFGDILSDLGGGVAGSLGILPSANVGARHGMFEPVHGSAPGIAGKGMANPAGSILSAAMMIEYLGHKNIADIIRDSVRITIEKGFVTPDLGGSLSNHAFTDGVIRELQSLLLLFG